MKEQTNLIKIPLKTNLEQQQQPPQTKCRMALKIPELEATFRAQLAAAQSENDAELEVGERVGVLFLSCFPILYIYIYCSFPVIFLGSP